MNLSSQICRLHELHAAGALDDREFARAKHALLRQATAERRPRRRRTGAHHLLRSVRTAAAAVATLTAGF